MTAPHPCACGHEDTMHAVYLDRPCLVCKCPGFHDTPRMIKVPINRQWPLYLPSHRAYRPEWTDEKGWEPERIESMSHHIGYGSVVYDIGAEQGDMPALWASWGADVFVVEPNAKSWPCIRATFEGNELRPVGFFEGFASDTVALGGWSGDSKSWPRSAYGTIDGATGFAHLAQQGDAIPQATIDHLVAYSGWVPTAITIDVEGSELRVLNGATNTLRAARPLVWCSVHTDLPWVDEFYGGFRLEDVAAFMAEHGYVAEHLATDHEIHMLYTPEEKA